MMGSVFVEMAGIEPASERIDPRNSTSVACRILSPQGSRWASNPAASCELFRTFSSIMCGTPPLSRPIRHRVEHGAGGRGLTSGGRLL